MNFTIYPYLSEHSSILSYWLKTNQENRIISIVMPKSWYDPTDVFPAENNIDVRHDIYDEIDRSDGIIIFDSQEAKQLYDEILTAIKYAIDSNKHVYCYMKLKKEDEIKPRNPLFHSIPSEETIHIKDDDNRTFNQQKSIIVVVGDMLRGMNTVCSVCGFAENMSSAGYRITIVSDSANLSLLPNHYMLPYDLYYDSNMSLEDRIYYINMFFNSVEKQTTSDIIVVYLSDGMMRYSNEYCGGFGINSYITAMALTVDYFILNIILDFAKYSTREDLTDFCMYFKYRFGMEIDALGITDLSVDEDAIECYNELCYYHNGKNSILDVVVKHKGENFFVFNSYSGRSYVDLAHNCMSKLSNNIEII